MVNILIALAAVVNARVVASVIQLDVGYVQTIQSRKRCVETEAVFERLSYKPVVVHSQAFATGLK